MSEQACKASPQHKLAEMVSLMSSGARVLLDGIPNDPSFLSSSIGSESAKEIAAAIQALQEQNEELRHDIEQAIRTSSELATEVAQARNAALEEAALSLASCPDSHWGPWCVSVIRDLKKEG